MERLTKRALGWWVVTALAVPAWSQVTVRVDLSSAGAQASGTAVGSISSDGRYVLFASGAGNLVAGDTNAVFDVFLHDLSLRTTERVSVGAGGIQGDFHSSLGVNPGRARYMSSDDRYVVYESRATNLVPNDTNGFRDIFVLDRQTATVELTSVSSAGTQANTSCWAPCISGDARYVAFETVASNLVAGDTNGLRDAFVRDRVTGITERVSVSTAGTEANAACYEPVISGDGRYVVFSSNASTLVSGDTNNAADIFLRDRVAGTTVCVSLDPTGAPGNGGSDWCSISADGSTIVFLSAATNLLPGDNNGSDDVFARDRVTGAMEIASVSSSGVLGNASSGMPSASSDGRYVVFESYATNFAPVLTGGNQIYARDRAAGLTELVSVTLDGGVQDEESYEPSVADDGIRVSFLSYASNLVPGDTNGADAFVRVRSGGLPVVAYCTAKVSSSGCTPTLTSTGIPSASAGSGFVIAAAQVLDGQIGILFYGVHGAKDFAFQGGRMCVAPPLKRTPVEVASATGSPPCIGEYAFDFNEHIGGGGDATLVPGQEVWCQYWTRDGASPSGVGLTGALRFLIIP